MKVSFSFSFIFQAKQSPCFQGLGVICGSSLLKFNPKMFSEDETSLATTIKKFQLSGFPLTIGRVCQLAYQYARVNNIPGFSDERQTAGRKWLRGFLVRHPDITLKKAHNLSIARAMGANPTVIGNWFQLLKKIQDTAGIISPDQIWSGDETGVQNVPKEVKVLGVKHIRTFQQVSSE